MKCLKLCGGHLLYTTFIHLFTQNVRVRKILCFIRRWNQPDVSGPAIWCNLVYAIFLHLFAQNVWVLGPINEWIQPDVIGPTAWCHLVCTNFLHLFTQNVGVRIILGPIREWIHPDVSYATAWCHNVYRYGNTSLQHHNSNITLTFLHLFTENVRMKMIMGPLREWIEPDVSDPAVWRLLVYAIFPHLFT